MKRKYKKVLASEDRKVRREEGNTKRKEPTIRNYKSAGSSLATKRAAKHERKRERRSTGATKSKLGRPSTVERREAEKKDATGAYPKSNGTGKEDQ